MIPRISGVEKELPSRKFLQELKLELEKAFESFNIPDQIKEKVGDCFVRLLKSGWAQEEFPKIIKSMISEELKRLKRYEESEILLNIFYKACEKDLRLVYISWYNHYPQREKVEESMFKLFDSIRAIKEAAKYEQDFEMQFNLIKSSFEILSEAYYRRLISFLLDCIAVLENDKPKNKIRYIGESYREFMKKYSEKYPNAKIFFNEIVKDVRNAFAHADYELDVINRVIIIKDKDKILHKLNEEKVSEILKYLFKVCEMYIWFYWYILLYIVEKLNIWDLIFEEIKNL